MTTVQTIVVIAVLAMAIRLATGADPALAAGLVGGLVVVATGYGLWSHRRFQLPGWLAAWGVIAGGLLSVIGGAVVEGLAPTPASHPATATIALTLTGDVLAVVGLCLLIRWRMPGRSSEALITAVVAVLAAWFALLAMVVVPGHGWHPGVQLPSMAVPALEFVTLWLTGSLMSMTERHPVAYRYLLGAFGCLFFSHAVSSALFLAGGGSSPVPLDAVALWGACLWACAVLHPSQRVAFEPVPLRSMRPSWPHVGLLMTATLMVPGVLGVQALIGEPIDTRIVALGSALLPVLVVMYLLQQVFARSAAEYRAQHDALTGVCNRVLFNDRLAAGLVDARRSDDSLAVMFLDLDRFKSINDSLGHAVGNQLLQAVVKRLQSSLRPHDLLARMGGDEFTILVPDVGDKAHVANIAERVLRIFGEPFNVGGRLLPVQVSIGVAVHPDDGDDADELFKNADTAMYQAKAAGRNTYVVYDTAMSARAQLRFALESSLRSALEQGRLTVHYQPKFRTADGQMVGVEALARWQHPRLGMIPPWAFIPLAEESNLIGSLGEWVLETACIQARQWSEWTDQPFSVAVNLSPRQFVCQSVVGTVAQVLERTDCDPANLELEVTESVLMEHMDAAAASLGELRAMGIKCSIDDFGTGYSALTYLTDIPVDAIKIDPSFVRRIDSESGAAPIVGAVIALAHSLDLQVIAEGVETDAQFQFLRANSCDYVQGFRFSPPVPADEIEGFLRDHRPLLPVSESIAGAGDCHVLPSARLASLLAGVAGTAGWPHAPDRADVEAVLRALHTGDAAALLAARSRGQASARMAVGTLAGLASITGGLSAAGVLPKATQDIAASVLQQATGLGVGPAPSASAPVKVAEASADKADRSGVRSTLEPPSSGSNPDLPSTGATLPSPPSSGPEPLPAASGPAGQAGASGGQGNGAPGKGSGAPGNSGNAPGQGSGLGSPGNSGNAPEQNGPGAPGNSGSTPGQTGTAGSGKSGNAPGHGR